MNKAIQIGVIVLLVILSVLALGGGWMLINDPTGESMQLPIDLLKDTPFSDYIIPGIILFVFIGVFSLIVAIMAILKKKEYATLIAIEGILLIGWLSIELLLNSDFYAPVLHIPLYFIGFILTIVGIIQVIKEKQSTFKSNLD